MSFSTVDALGRVLGPNRTPPPSHVCWHCPACRKEQTKNTQMISVGAVSCMGMKLPKENTTNPRAVPGGEDPQGHFPHPMAMVEGARSCTQVSEPAPQKLT